MGFRSNRPSSFISKRFEIQIWKILSLVDLDLAREVISLPVTCDTDSNNP